MNHMTFRKLYASNFSSLPLDHLPVLLLGSIEEGEVRVGGGVGVSLIQVKDVILVVQDSLPNKEAKFLDKPT